MDDEGLSREELVAAIHVLAKELDSGIEVLYELGGLKKLTYCVRCNTRALGSNKYAHPHAPACYLRTVAQSYRKLSTRLAQRDRRETRPS